MLRASVILKNTRIDKGLELGEVSKKLKIPYRHLDSLENDNSGSFPAEPYCSLIVKDYADYLGLNGNDVLSLFRRDFAQKKKAGKNKKNLLSVTPRLTFSLGVLVLIVSFTVYLVTEYIKFNQPPNLKVSWPENLTVNTSTVEISGITDMESTVRVNQDLVIVDPSGAFQKKVQIIPPETKITVESTSPNGKSTIDSRALKIKK